MPWVERIYDRTLEWLIVRGHRTVFQSAWNKQPTERVGMHDERLVPGDGVVAFSPGSRLVVGRFRGRKVGHVEAGPRLFCFVPPYQFLAFAPGLTIGPC